jgi:1,4-alpha-glucan branching enzyme
VFHVNDDAKVIAYHRFSLGGPGDDVVIVANFSNHEFGQYRIGFPRSGEWKLRFNSDWKHYSDDFGDGPAGDLKTDDQPYDGLKVSAVAHLPPYTALIYSQDAADS